jgi:hypothetical protein
LTNEEFYDKEVAPVLADLARKCNARNMSFVTAIEFEPDDTALTLMMGPDPGLAITMMYMCAKAGVNIDAYLIGLIRHARTKNINMDQSAFLKLALGGTND